MEGREPERAVPKGRDGFRKRYGLDRSGPAPPQTRRGQPLRPWTLPNLVGYLRLAAIPVFLVIALDSGDGRDPYAAGLYFLIAASDYLDGLLARATGQYSRMGALLDPVVDRATILAGVVVCWHFELLPRWALAVLAVRELVTFGLANLALHRGEEIEINWFGRLAVWPVMAAIFFAMISTNIAWEILLYLGLIAGIIATVAYARRGIRPASQPSSSA